MKIKIFLPAIIMLFSTSAIAENNYLCVTDLVTGFNHNPDRDTWEHATFLPGQRFSISEILQDNYKAEKLDDQNPWSAICTPRLDQKEDSFSCTNRTTELHFNRKELRFTLFRYFGY